MKICSCSLVSNEHYKITFKGCASQIDDNIASLVIAQLLFLQSENTKKPIHMYINRQVLEIQEATQEEQIIVNLIFCLLMCHLYAW